MIGLTDNYNYKYSFKMYIFFSFDEIPGQLSYQLKRGNDQEKPWSSSLLVKLFRLRKEIERNVVKL